MLNVLVTKSIANKVFEIYFRLTFQAASSNLKTNRAYLSISSNGFKLNLYYY